MNQMRDYYKMNNRIKRVFSKLKYYWKENKQFILKYLYVGIISFLVKESKKEAELRKQKIRKFKQLTKGKREIVFDMKIN